MPDLTTNSNKYQLELLIAGFVDKVTCQFFIKGGRLNYTSFGTGVFVQFGTDLYIITASHIAEKINDGLYIFIGAEKLIEIKGAHLTTDYKKDHKVDIAFISIKNNLKSLLLESFNSLKPFNIQISHTMTPTDNYLVFGYPEVNVRKNKERFISTHPTGHLLNPSSEKVYNYHKIDKRLYYVLDFKGSGEDMITGKMIKGFFYQNGLSGGGLWNINRKPLTENKQEVKVTLIGIMTDQLTNKYSCLIGNKIDPIIHAISKYENNIEARNLIANSDMAIEFKDKNED